MCKIASYIGGMVINFLTNIISQRKSVNSLFLNRAWFLSRGVVALCLSILCAAFFPLQAQVAKEDVVAAAPAAQDIQKAVKMTIGVVVNPTLADGSTWDYGTGADLVLCGTKGCYVSQGLEQPAVFYEGSSGLRLLKKAGACRDTLKCVFRGVEVNRLISLGDPFLQVADVDYVSHSYMEKFKLERPFHCAVDGGVTTCEDGVHERSFSLWAMDESIAIRGGKDGLDFVLFKAIQSQRVAVLTGRLTGVRDEVRQSAARFYKLVLGNEISEACLKQTDFLAESFYVAGLADAEQRRAESVIKDFLGARPLSQLSGVVQRTPQIYWAFLNIAAQFKDFSEAGSAQFDKETAGLRLVATSLQASNEHGSSEESSVLHFGWQVRSRARALVESCREKPPLAVQPEGDALLDSK